MIKSIIHSILLRLLLLWHWLSHFSTGSPFYSLLLLLLLLLTDYCSRLKMEIGPSNFQLISAHINGNFSYRKWSTNEAYEINYETLSHALYLCDFVSDSWVWQMHLICSKFFFIQKFKDMPNELTHFSLQPVTKSIWMDVFQTEWLI